MLWNATRCIHTAICLRRLPAVFDVKARPWIDLSKADAQAVADAVSTCPTGALRWEAIHNVADEVGGRPDYHRGEEERPALVRGRVRIDGPGGRTLANEYPVALCRCGASDNKPFCDNSHRLIHFRDHESTDAP